VYIGHSVNGANSYFDLSLKYVKLFLFLWGPACEKNTFIAANDDTEWLPQNNILSFLNKIYIFSNIHYTITQELITRNFFMRGILNR
jgi:hypothetical protein